MTKQGYKARLYAIEWHANLWLRYGTPIERCEAMRAYCSECLDADFYGCDRPETDDPQIAHMMRYLDLLFTTRSPLVSFD